MRINLSLLSLILLLGCTDPKYGHDYLTRPNWDNRHAKWVDIFITRAIGTEYRGGRPSYCQVSSLNSTTDRYTFTDRPNKGCTYWYDVDKATRKIVAADFTGMKQACSMTLN